ncbi:hypothetical protein [Bacillus sp. AFS017336]|uniref:hypothetical protein n=1 Tax=Bacillus sp. AFS017336 TaxID=2033489 RepID=UPI000BF0A19F|nr:hypothetical protein [Bacillus sp. AFS017336]PEL03585.1 hypothetical protein CN601_21885 [Bacillus sp. AFS017336]
MKLKKFFIYFIPTLIMIVSSKLVTNYYIVRTHIEPLSKNTSLLTLLFMLFFGLGMFVIIAVLFINSKQL